ncbi:KICSTOR complex protein SZT2-like isoform X2 [Babylonia areolata]|uniref:KICSTOR complex protein SZT2-like isoform X2 n=1 Tax=Babylonia areolata TaxID=304850 RepID=UPI003FCF7C15
MQDDSGEVDSATEKEAPCVDAEEVFVLMKKNTRVSRNIRACWFFRHLKSTITFTPPQELHLEELSQDLTLASLIPADGEPMLDGSQTYNVVIHPCTTVTFLASRYRIAFTLDLSPSVVAVDVARGQLISQEIFHNFCKCLRALVKPFQLPGSQLMFLPKLFITVIAHTPVVCCAANQVLVQGVSVSQENVERILHYTRDQLHGLEHKLSTSFTKLLDLLNARKVEGGVSCGDMNEDEEHKANLMHKLTEEIQYAHELGLVDMLRCGLLALQMLPENSSSGIVVITDGVVGVPEANLMEALLTQLRNSTITCSFLKVGSALHLQRQLGHVPNFELMQFIATATFGGYFFTCPDVSEDESGAPNVYHQAMYYWSFQKGLEGFCYDGSQDDPDVIGSPSWIHRRLYTHPVHGSSFGQEVLRKRHSERTVQAGLSDVLSVRLREGYTIREVHFLKGGSEIEVKLVLPWRDSGKVEYGATAAWPIEKNKIPTKVEIFVEGTYDFLHEITCNSGRKINSVYRSAHIKKFWQLLQNIGQTDKLLVHLQSFDSNPANYEVPEYIRSGVPLFVLDPVNPVINSQLSSNDSKLSSFASFWKRAVMLDTSVWQKWMHSHRLGLVLEQDLPLPRYLHVPNSSGRFNILQCRQALASLTQLLRHWATFVLAENHSYIKFLSRSPDKPPSFFCLLRLTSKPPYIILRLGFLGGTPSFKRREEIQALKQALAQLKFPQRNTQKSEKKSVLKVTADSKGAQERKAPLQREWSEINCCTLLRKPVEKILIRYEQKPEDLTVVDDLPFTVPKDEREGGGGQGSMTMRRPVNSKFTTLSHYLVHHRWVWSMQADSSVPLSPHTMAKVLQTLTKIRLQEGFHFASANSGVCNMVVEVDMMDSKFAPASVCQGEVNDDEHQTCVVQYILFPPHSKTSRDSVSEEDMDEMETTEDDREIQIVTECWVEPQFGVCINNTPERLHFEHLNCVELSRAFFEVDFECISSLTTFNHLLYLCQHAAKTPTLGTDLTQSRNSSPPSTPGRRHTAPGKLEEEEKKSAETSMTFVSFHLNLVSLLPRSQQAELLFSTFVVGTGKSSEQEAGVDPKGSNELLFTLLFERLKGIHDKEYILSAEEAAKYMEQLRKRDRDLNQHPFPFHCKAGPAAGFPETVSQKTDGAPMPESADKGRATATPDRTASTPATGAATTTTTSHTPGTPNTPNSSGTAPTPGTTSNSNRTPDPLFSANTSSGTGNGRFSGKDSLHGLPMWKCYMKAVSSAHILLTFIPASYDDLLLLNEDTEEGGRERDMSGEEKKNGEGEGGGVGARAMPTDAAAAEAVGEADHTATAATTPAATCPTFEDTDSCHTGHTSAGGRRGSGALSGFGNVSSTIITVTEPSPCQSPERSVAQSREDDVKEWVNTSCSAAVPPAKGPMVIPIYVYDCHYHSITESLINRWTFSLPPDIHEDMTFTMEGDEHQTSPVTRGRLASFDKEASVVEEKEEVEFPRQGWRSSLDRKSVDSLMEGVGDFRRQCHLITESYFSCFVTGLYESLRHNYFVDHHDMDAAISSICQETLPLEVDMTPFLLSSCGHLKRLVTQARKELITAKETDLARKHSVRFLEVVDIQSDDGEDIIMPEILQMPRKMVSLLPSLWADMKCEYPAGIHRLVQDKFLATLHRFFQPVASMPDYFFFSPEAQQRASVCDEYNDQGVKEDSTDERTDDNTDASVKEEEEGEGGTGAGDFTPRGGGGPGAEARDRGNHSAHVSVDSNMDDSLSDMDLNATQDTEQEVVPLFIHFTCTVKRRNDYHHTSVTQLPLCLGDLLNTMKDPLLAVNFGEFQVTFDINCLTLPPDSDFDNFPRRGGFMRSMSNQSQSSSNRQSECEDDRDSSHSPAPSVDFVIDQPMSHLPPIQREAVLIFKDEVEWLMRDEVAGALKHMHPINADALDFVTKHVKDSYSQEHPSCQYQRVSLQFVYGPDRSLKPFIEEFERLSQPGYRLTKVKDFYFLTVDRAHANNILHAKALQTALVELSHEGGEGSNPKVVDSSKLFPAMEERSHSLPNILPSSSPTATVEGDVSAAAAQGPEESGSGGGGGSSDENRPRSSSDAKFSKASVPEEVRLKQTAMAGKKEGEGEVSDPSVRRSYSSAQLQGSVASTHHPATTASPDVQSGGLSATKASPSALFGHRSRHFSAPSGQGTPQSRASTLPQTPSIGSSRGSGTSDAGFDGDVSDENMDDTASISDAGLGHPQLPSFWLILTIHSDCVELFFHTRATDQDGSVQRAEQNLVLTTTVSIQDICCKVNKQLLLNELLDSRMCNRLLVPEADEDVHWTDRRTNSGRSIQDAFEGDDEEESEESPNQGYLAATLDLEPGCFACDCVWKKLFFLHPRLKTGAQRQGTSRGLLSLRSVLNKFSVGNRKNMFVIKETSLADNVFYVKLKELTSSNQNEPIDVQADLESSMSEVSLSSLVQRTAESRIDAETRSEGDATSLASGYSRMSSRVDDMVELTVHGIAEPTTEIREDLMKVLQNRLDDTVLDVISVMLARNPQCKLRQEDVQFIQFPEEEATETLCLTIPSHAMLYLSALVFYLRQNLLLFLHTPCFHDDSPAFHFHDYVGGRWTPVPSDQVYLYLSPQAGGRKGLACVVCRLVDGPGNPVRLLGCPSPSRQAAANLPSVEEFQQMVETSVHQPITCTWGPGPTALLQFRIWQKGSLDMRQLKDRLTSAVSHALCDIIMEYTLMTAPVCTTPRNLQDIKALPVTSLPNSPVTVKKIFLMAHEEPERKPNLGRKLSDSIRIGLKPVPQSASPFQTLRETFSVRSRVSSPPPEISQSFDWSQVPPHQVASSGDQARASAPTSVTPPDTHSPELVELLAQYDRGDKGSLHPAFASLMQPWLAFCHEKKLASVYKMDMEVSTTHSVEYILKELQNSLPSVGVKAPLKVFKVLQYTTIDSAPISVPFFPCKPQPLGVDNQIESAMDSVTAAVGSVQFVVVAREHELWNITVVPDSSDYQAIKIPTQADLKAYQSGLKFHPKVGDLTRDKEASSGMNQTFVPRQKLLVMFVMDKKLVVYMYNFASDVTSGVDKMVRRLVNWHNARSQVLYSILHQKMGLFHHSYFEKLYANVMTEATQDSNPYMHSTGDIDNLIRYSAPPREVIRRHSSMTAQSRSISRVLNQYRPFDDTYKNLKPARPMHRTVNGSLGDHVARHGMQSQDIRSRYRKDAERMMKLQQIYLNWLQKSASNPNSPVSEEYMDLLKQSSRLFHYCATPLLFCQKWRKTFLKRNYLVKTAPAPPPPTPERETVTTKSRSRHSSGASVTSQRTRRSDSQDAGRAKRPPTTDPSPTPTTAAAPSSTGAAAAAATGSSASSGGGGVDQGVEEAWYQAMCQNFLHQYRNYLVSEFGFICINVQPNMTKRAGQSAKRKEEPRGHMTVNLHKTLASGIILMELSLRSKFFVLNMFVLDYLQLGISNHDMQLLFVDECEKYKDLIHVHSFAHDFHLRTINDYLQGNTSILPPDFHITDFLSDYLKIYPIPPSFARNCLAQESAVIRDLPCPGPQLFDYMRTQGRQFGMDVFRMSPLDVVESDYCFIKQDEFALVQIREPDVPGRVGGEGLAPGAQRSEETAAVVAVVAGSADVELDGYNVTLIITQDGARGLTAAGVGEGGEAEVLRLKFFVVLTRLKDIHPKRTLEKKFGDFRTSSSASVTSAAAAAAMGQNHSEGSDTGSVGGGAGVESEPSIAVAVKQHLAVRQEHINYLGYSNLHQTRIYTLLTAQINAGREKIEDMVEMSKVKCRRDYLWQRMSATTHREGRKKSKQPEDSLEPVSCALQPLSGGEFEELLQLVWQEPLNEVDPRLSVLSNMPPSWFSSLLPVLTARFGHACRFFPSQHAALHHTVILNSHWQDMFILLSVDSGTGCTALNQVLRNRGEEEEERRRMGEERRVGEEEGGGRQRSLSLLTEQKLCLVEDFVNVCCFHLWSSIL